MLDKNLISSELLNIAEQLHLRSRESGFDSVSGELAALDQRLWQFDSMEFMGAHIHNEGVYNFGGRIRQDGVSALIPIADGEQYVDALFDTFAAQSLFEGYFELIFIVNGDPGKTLEFVRSKAANVAFPVKILRLDTRNLSLARNAGLAFTLRRYFTFVDADDTLEKHFLLDALKCAGPNKVVQSKLLRLGLGRLSLDGYGRMLLQNLHDLGGKNRASMFTANGGKLAPRHLACGLRYNLNIKNGEDVVFWHNFLLQNDFTLATSYCPGRDNAYIRHAVSNSASRPQELTRDFLDQRMLVINNLRALKPKNRLHMEIIRGRCQVQGGMLMDLLDRLEDADHVLALAEGCADPEIKMRLYDRRFELARETCCPQNEAIFYKAHMAAIRAFGEEAILARAPVRKQKALAALDKRTARMLEDFSKLPDAGKAAWRKRLRHEKAPIFNASLFGDEIGVAFCHNFPPSSDPAAFVSARRLRQISGLHGALINWTCVAANMSNRKNDGEFLDFYGKYQAARIIRPGEATLWNPRSQISWAREACKAVRDINPDVIYSHALWIGSHLAALQYKKVRPSAKWYAEFSDPLSIGVDNRPRTCELDFERQYGGDFYAFVEAEVMTKADCLIFTNQNQKKLMIEANPFIKDKKAIYARSKSLIFPMPCPDFKNFKEVGYELEKDMAHIAFFGSLYKNRNLDVLFSLLGEYDRIKLHLFLLLNADLVNPGAHADRVRINETIDYFSTLNLASKMDFLYIEDTEFEGDPNPYMPSKFMDYLASGSKILLNCRPGSPLSRLSHKNIIKLSEFPAAYHNLLAAKKSGKHDAS